MPRTLLLAVSASAAVLAGASTAVAQEGRFHLGAGYTFLDFDEVEFNAVTVRGGYDFNEFFGVEGELSTGLGDESVTIEGVEIDTSLDLAFGLYAKAQYPLTEQFSVFGRLGYVYAELEAEAEGVGGAVSAEGDDNGVGFGAGAEYRFNGANAFRFEYTRYEFDDADADGFTLSYVRRF